MMSDQNLSGRVGVAPQTLAARDTTESVQTLGIALPVALSSLLWASLVLAIHRFM